MGRRETFPLLLHRILSETNEAGLQSIISWSASNCSFRVHDKDAFMTRVLPQYARQTRYKSFIRQLNLWGFFCVQQGEDRGAYTHESFVRGRLDLVKNMKRVKVKGAFTRATKSKGGACTVEIDLTTTPRHKTAEASSVSSTKENPDDAPLTSSSDHTVWSNPDLFSQSADNRDCVGMDSFDPRGSDHSCYDIPSGASDCSSICTMQGAFDLDLSLSDLNIIPDGYADTDADAFSSACACAHDGGERRDHQGNRKSQERVESINGGMMVSPTSDDAQEQVGTDSLTSTAARGRSRSILLSPSQAMRSSTFLQPPIDIGASDRKEPIRFTTPGMDVVGDRRHLPNRRCPQFDQRDGNNFGSTRSRANHQTPQLGVTQVQNDKSKRKCNSSSAMTVIVTPPGVAVRKRRFLTVDRKQMEELRQQQQQQEGQQDCVSPIFCSIGLFEPRPFHPSMQSFSTGPPR